MFLQTIQVGYKVPCVITVVFSTVRPATPPCISKSYNTVYAIGEARWGMSQRSVELVLFACKIFRSLD